MLLPIEILQELEDATAKGAEFLDQKYPQWTGFINVEDLAMNFADSCILGQIGHEIGQNFGDMASRVQQLGFDLGQLGFDIEEFEAAGPDFETIANTWEALRLFWLDRIDERRQSD